MLKNDDDDDDYDDDNDDNDLVENLLIFLVDLTVCDVSNKFLYFSLSCLFIYLLPSLFSSFFLFVICQFSYNALLSYFLIALSR